MGMIWRKGFFPFIARHSQTDPNWLDTVSLDLISQNVLGKTYRSYATMSELRILYMNAQFSSKFMW